MHFCTTTNRALAYRPVQRNATIRLPRRPRPIVGLRKTATGEQKMTNRFGDSLVSLQNSYLLLKRSRRLSANHDKPTCLDFTLVMMGAGILTSAFPRQETDQRIAGTSHPKVARLRPIARLMMRAAASGAKTLNFSGIGDEPEGPPDGEKSRRSSKLPATTA